jgi:hypothetical protein
MQKLRLREIQKRDRSRRMIPELATPAEVATALRTTLASLAQMRYRGDGPKFVRAGRRRVLYRWADVEQWITDSVHSRTDISGFDVSGETAVGEAPRSTDNS